MYRFKGLFLLLFGENFSVQSQYDILSTRSQLLVIVDRVKAPCLSSIERRKFLCVCVKIS